MLQPQLSVDERMEGDGVSDMSYEKHFPGDSFKHIESVLGTLTKFRGIVSKENIGNLNKRFLSSSLHGFPSHVHHMHQPSLYWIALVNNSFAANFQATNLFWINFMLFQKQRYCCQIAGIHTRNQLIKLLGNIKQAWYNLYLVKILFYYHTQVPYMRIKCIVASKYTIMKQWMNRNSMVIGSEKICTILSKCHTRY